MQNTYITYTPAMPSISPATRGKQSSMNGAVCTKRGFLVERQKKIDRATGHIATAAGVVAVLPWPPPYQ